MFTNYVKQIKMKCKCIHNVIHSKLIVISNGDRSYYISMGHIPIRMLHASLTMVFDSLTFKSQQQPI